MADSEFGGAYEVHASVLRGSRLCGGPLGIPASAGGGSGFAVKVFGSSLESLGFRFGRAPRCATISSARALSLLLPRRSRTSGNSGNLCFVTRSHYNRHGILLLSHVAVLPIAYTETPIACADSYSKPLDRRPARFGHLLVAFSILRSRRRCAPWRHSSQLPQETRAR